MFLPSKYKQMSYRK